MLAAEQATRKKILETAASIFSEVGFTKATIRDICHQAHVNLASINYHFKDKEKLYGEVLRYTCQIADQTVPINISATDPKEVQLKNFVYLFLQQIMSQGPAAMHGKLMAREMIEPSGALDKLVEERIRPMANELKRIVELFLGPKVSEQSVLLAGHSIVGQILHFHHNRAIVERLHPRISFSVAGLKIIAEHITNFSIAAMKHLDSETSS